MKKRFINYFQSRNSYQSFWLLLIGFILILAAEFSVFGMYLTYGRNTYQPAHLVEEVVRTAYIINNMPPQKLPAVTKALSTRQLHVDMASHPMAKAKVLFADFDMKAVKEYILTHPHGFIISMPLNSGKWINIKSLHPNHKWLDIGLIISMIVLLTGLILLCALVIKRVTMPVSSLAQAVKRFGMDVNAPPLALFGPPEMQNVIRAFNEMQERIRRLINDRTQMLAAISHDLRTPITRLQLRAEYLKGTEQYEKAIADLEEMETMISSILSFARDYARDEKMELFDINALIQSLCDDLIDIGKPVTYHTDGQRTPFFGRISALKRALNNIVENAIKYGDNVEVTLKQNQAPRIQIRVTDEGPGIPDDQMEKVFEPFYRVDTSRSLQKTGTGLGLAVARDIILAHGGDIKLSNRSPHGLTVLITLDMPASHQ